MTTVSNSQSPRRWASQTGISNYDRVAGFLLAMLALLGLAVTLLFLVWLTSVLQFKRKAPPMEYLPQLAGRGDNAVGVARDLEEPGIEELADVAEPQISETLEAVTDAVSSVAGAIEATDGNAALMGTGSGLGDSRAAGPGGEGDADIIPIWERWRVRWSTNSTANYAQQLDYFKIHLGLLGGGKPRVDYAHDLSLATPKTYFRPNAKGEDRLFFYSEKGAMRELDLRLLEQAGLDTKNRDPLQLFPNETVAVLIDLELRAANRPETQIKQTIFGVQGSAGAYQFRVLEQTFRAGR